MKVIVSVCWLAVTFSSWTQSVIQIEKRANEALSNQQYELAKVDFQTLFSREPKSPTYNYNYGICLFYTNERSAALNHFQLAATLGTGICEAQYYIGRIHHLNYDFIRAISAYNAYVTCFPEDPKNARREIERCNHGKKLLVNTTALEVLKSEQLPMNGFLSRIDFSDLGLSGGYYTDLTLQSKIDKKKGFIPHTFVKAGNKYKIYPSYVESADMTSLYLKTKKGDVWSEPIKIPLPMDEKTDVLYPFYHTESGHLYFSSNGFNAMGGFDFFKVSFDPASMTLGEVVNLGFPFSSTDDDFLFVPLDSAGNHAAFSTIRSSDIGKIEWVQAIYQKSNAGIVLVQGAFKDQVNPKNTNLQIKVKDLERGLEYGPFVSDSSGNYQVVLPGEGSYEFVASISGTQQVFIDKKVLPKQVSGVVFEQNIDYTMNDSKELASFSYKLNGKANEEMLSLKSKNIASLNKMYNPKEGGTLPVVDDNGNTTLSQNLFDLGFTDTSSEIQAQALSDKLLEISNIGEDFNDKLLFLDREKTKTAANIRQLNLTADALKERIVRDTSIAVKKVYQSYLMEIYDSLVEAKNTLATNQALTQQLENDRRKWIQNGHEDKATKLSENIQLYVLNKEQDSLSAYINAHKKSLSELMAFSKVLNEDSIALEALKTQQQTLKEDKALLIGKIEQSQKRIAELESQVSTASKKDKLTLQAKMEEEKSTLSKFQKLLTLKEDEQSATALEISSIQQRLQVSTTIGNLPTFSPTIKPDLTEVLAQQMEQKALQKQLVLTNGSNRANEAAALDELNAEMQVVRFKMERTKGNDLEALSEQYQKIEAQIENLKEQNTLAQNNQSIKNSDPSSLPVTGVNTNDQPKNETAAIDENGQPKNETAAFGENGQPKNETAMVGENGQPKNETASVGQNGQPKNENALAGENGQPKNETPSVGQNGQPKNETAAIGENGQPKNETAAIGENGQPKNETAAIGENGQPKNETAAVGENGQTKNETATIGENGQPKNETAAIDENGQPKNETAAIDENGQPKNETAAIDENGQPKNETAAIGENGQPKNENAVAGENGQPKNETAMVGENGQPKNETVAIGENGQPKNETAMVGENGQPKNETAAIGENGQPKNETASVGENGQPKNETAAVGENGQPKNETTAVGENGQPKNDNALAGDNGQPKNETAMVGENGQPKNETAVIGENGQPKNETAAIGENGQPKNETAAVGENGQPKNETAAIGENGQPKNETAMVGENGQPKNETAAVGENGQPKNETALVGENGQPKNETAMVGENGQPKNETAAVGENGQPKNETAAVGENGQPKNETAAVGENGQPKNETPAIVENGQPKNETAAIGENGQPKNETAAIGENGQPKNETATVGENGQPKNETAAVGENGQPKNETAMVGENGQPKNETAAIGENGQTKNETKKDQMELEAQSALAKTPQDSQDLAILARQIGQVSSMVDLRESMPLEQFSVIFNKDELEEYTLALQERQASYNARNKESTFNLEAIQELGNLAGSMQEERIDSVVFSGRKVSQEEAQKIAQSGGYDVYVTYRKEFVQLEEEKTQLEKTMDLLKIQYFRSIDSNERKKLEMDLLDISSKIIKVTEQKDQKMRQMMGMNDHEIYAGLILEGVLPQGAGIRQELIKDSQDLSFSINDGPKSQNNQYPVTQNLPEGLIFRVQVGAFKNKVPDYFFREFTPVSGEMLKNGLTAYLAGFFEGSESAIAARQGIRDLGYKDAFVVAYCDGKRIPFAQAVAYEKNGMCRIRSREELLTEAFSILKPLVDSDSSIADKPKEVFYTVQVASLAKEDNGKLAAVPELFYQKATNGNFKYSSGKFMNLDEAKSRRDAMKTIGFQDAFVIAYRDGIKVSFAEAEIALNYMKEPLMAAEPLNHSLQGTTLKELQPTYVQLKKSEKILSKEQLGNYNSLRFVTVESQKQLTSSPILMEDISPLELIYYADFEVQTIKDSLMTFKFSVPEASTFAPLLHDVALNNNIPFDVIKQDENRIEFLFYCQKEEELVQLNSISQKLNIQP